MTAYELELIAMAKNRGDSLSRQLADTVKKQDEQIDALKEQLDDCTCQGGHSQAYLKAKKRIMHDFNNALIDLQKAREK